MHPTPQPWSLLSNVLGILQDQIMWGDVHVLSGCAILSQEASRDHESLWDEEWCPVDPVEIPPNHKCLWDQYAIRSTICLGLQYLIWQNHDLPLRCNCQRCANHPPYQSLWEFHSHRFRQSLSRLSLFLNTREISSGSHCFPFPCTQHISLLTEIDKMQTQREETEGLDERYQSLITPSKFPYHSMSPGAKAMSDAYILWKESERWKDVKICVKFTPPSRCDREGCGKKGDLRCSHCKSAHYCSRECQTLHWGFHKSQCGKWRIGRRKWQRRWNVMSVGECWWRSSYSHTGDCQIVRSWLQVLAVNLMNLSLFSPTVEKCSPIADNVAIKMDPIFVVICNPSDISVNRDRNDILLMENDCGHLWICWQWEGYGGSRVWRVWIWGVFICRCSQGYGLALVWARSRSPQWEDWGIKEMERGAQLYTHTPSGREGCIWGSSCDHSANTPTSGWDQYLSQSPWFWYLGKGLPDIGHGQEHRVSGCEVSRWEERVWHPHPHHSPNRSTSINPPSPPSIWNCSSLILSYSRSPHPQQWNNRFADTSHPQLHPSAQQQRPQWTNMTISISVAE